MMPTFTSARRYSYHHNVAYGFQRLCLRWRQSCCRSPRHRPRCRRLPKIISILLRSAPSAKYRLRYDGRHRDIWMIFIVIIRRHFHRVKPADREFIMAAAIYHDGGADISHVGRIFASYATRFDWDGRCHDTPGAWRCHLEMAWRRNGRVVNGITMPINFITSPVASGMVIAKAAAENILIVAPHMACYK